LDVIMAELDNPSGDRTLVYSILRYAPNPIRNEWVNIGVLLYDPESGERRLRMIEDQEEFARVRRLHPAAREELLSKVGDHLERSFREARQTLGEGDWQKLLAKLEDALSGVWQLAPETALRGVYRTDLDTNLERLYADHVAAPHRGIHVGTAGSRAAMRSYCAQVWKHAQLWSRIERAVRASEYTFAGDPMRLDYCYRRNGTRGFVQTLSVTRSPADCKLVAYTAERIARRAPFRSEFTAVTDVALEANDERHAFVRDTLRDAGIEPVPLDHFAVWVAKLKPLLQ
jgi:hypothetical protein